MRFTKTAAAFALAALAAVCASRPGLAQTATLAIYQTPPVPPAPDFFPRVVLITKKYQPHNVAILVSTHPDPLNGWRMEAYAFDSVAAALKWLNPGEGYGSRFYNEEVVGLWELGKKRDLVLKIETHSEPARIEAREWKTQTWEVK